jgi:hypothetical protein
MSWGNLSEGKKRAEEEECEGKFRCPNICNMMQELRVTRMLAKDEVMMRVGNRARVVVISLSTCYIYIYLRDLY